MTSRVHGVLRATASRRLVWALLVPLLAGCASFRESKRLDVGPFAENTVGMIGEVQRATKPAIWIHLKKYDHLASVTDVRRAYAPARTLMRGVALYSTQVVSIYESPLAEDRKSSELARYLDDAVRDRLKDNPNAELFMTQARLDSAVTQVRQARGFMDALSAAQPVVSAALSYGNSIYDSIEIRIDVAALDLGARIEEEYAPVKRSMAELNELQLRATHSYALLSQYRKGREAALEALRAHDPEAAAAMPAGKAPSDAAMDAYEKRVLAAIDAHVHVREDLLRQFENYRAEQLELDDLRSRSQEAARLGRITLILWARSHRNLAAGVTVPAAINVMGMVKSAASSASGVVL